MSTFIELNTYSTTTLTYDIAEQELELTTPTASFKAPTVTWDWVRTLGALTGSGIEIEYDVSASTGATVAFNSTASSRNTLTTANPSTGVYTITGILDAVDYAAAVATITPDSSNVGNVSYQVKYENTNETGNITVDYLGVV